MDTQTSLIHPLSVQWNQPEERTRNVWMGHWEHLSHYQTLASHSLSSDLSDKKLHFESWSQCSQGQRISCRSGAARWAATKECVHTHVNVHLEPVWARLQRFYTTEKMCVHWDGGVKSSLRTQPARLEDAKWETWEWDGSWSDKRRADNLFSNKRSQWKEESSSGQIHRWARKQRPPHPTDRVVRSPTPAWRRVWNVSGMVGDSPQGGLTLLWLSQASADGSWW